jgi:hypothetical protein
MYAINVAPSSLTQLFKSKEYEKIIDVIQNNTELDYCNDLPEPTSNTKRGYTKLHKLIESRLERYKTVHEMLPEVVTEPDAKLILSFLSANTTNIVHLEQFLKDIQNNLTIITRNLVGFRTTTPYEWSGTNCCEIDFGCYRCDDREVYNFFCCYGTEYTCAWCFIPGMLIYALATS